MLAARLVPLAGALALLAGCATTMPQSDAEYTQAIAAAQRTFTQSGPDQAVASFEEIARRNPTRGEPWAYVARIQFDQEKYGQAIVAADEALSREPENTVAKSVRVVAGMRVALRSLADLRADSRLASTTRGEALVLANSLREALGQDDLFPDRKVAEPPRRPTRPPRGTTSTAPRAPAAAVNAAESPATPATAATSAPTPSAAPTPTAPPPSAPPASRSPDPFGSLRAN